MRNFDLHRGGCSEALPRRAVLGAAAGALLCLAGCSSASDPATQPSGASFDVSESWVSEEVTGRTLAPGSRITIKITGARLEAFPGCNELRGTITIAADQLTLSDSTLTEKGCEPATLMDQDQWFTSWLTDGVTISMPTPTQLVLADDGIEASFRRANG